MGLRTFAQRGLRIAAAVTLALGCRTAPAQVAADTADTGGLEEIVVTATRREERLQDVPISVTAINEEQMAAQGLRGIDDVARVTPGATFQRMGVSLSANYNDENSDINIRGIESQAGTSTTGIYIDDTPVQTRHVGFGSVNPFPALFDLDRVEILRGPQGTLFGAGSEGGAVRFISPEPDPARSSGYVRAEWSNTQGGADSYNFGAAAGGPMIDGVLAFRVSASYQHDGGYVDRVNYSHPGSDPLPPPTYLRTTETDANWQQTKTVRVALKWNVTDALSITPSLYYQELAINDTAAYWVSLSNRDQGIFRNGNALTNPSTDPFTLSAIKLEWRLPGAELTSNTSYLARNQHSVSDYTQYWRATFLSNSYPQPGDAGPAPFGDIQRNFYQEVRLASTDAAARIEWNAGVFYSHLDENVPENIFDPTLDAEFTAATGGFPLCGAPGVSALGAPCPNGLLLLNPVQRNVDTQFAEFGEVAIKFADNWKFTAGLRISEVSGSGEVLQTTGALALSAGVTQHLTAPSEHPITPKFVLGYQPEPDNLYYVSASKGYRVGGTNSPVNPIVCAGNLAALGIPLGPNGAPAQAPPQYSSDSLWSFEIGAKNALLEHRLQIDSSLYFIDWSQIQQNVYLPACGNQFVANLGHVQSRGGDLDIKFRPLDALTLGLTAAYTDAKYTRTACTQGLQFNGSACIGSGAGQIAAPIVSQGDRLLGAPWTVLSSAEYIATLPFLSGPKGYLHLDYQYTTAQTATLAFQDSRNTFYDNTIPGLPVTRNLQLRAGVRWRGFDLSAFGNNLTNEHPLLFESRDIPPSAAAPGSAPDNVYYARSTRPRTIGLTATYRY